MTLRQRHDSSRDLLEELEEGWGAPSPPAAAAVLPVSSPNDVITATSAASADVERPEQAPTDDVPAHMQSNPDLSSLDEGWLDELFPGEGEGDDDDEEEEDDEPEPELPDERLDPEAFALAKKAREERAAKKRDRRRLKAEAKRARQKARAEAMRQKQKAKKSRGASPARRAPEPAKKKSERRGRNESAPKVGALEVVPSSGSAEETTELAATGVPAAKPRAKSPVAPGRSPSTLASVKLLAIVLAILLALAAAVAAIAK